VPNNDIATNAILTRTLNKKLNKGWLLKLAQASGCIPGKINNLLWMRKVSEKYEHQNRRSKAFHKMGEKNCTVNRYGSVPCSLR
jgi:hypothetical protein